MPPITSWDDDFSANHFADGTYDENLGGLTPFWAYAAGGLVPAGGDGTRLFNAWTDPRGARGKFTSIEVGMTMEFDATHDASGELVVGIGQPSGGWFHGLIGANMPLAYTNEGAHFHEWQNAYLEASVDVGGGDPDATHNYLNLASSGTHEGTFVASPSPVTLKCSISAAGLVVCWWEWGGAFPYASAVGEGDPSFSYYNDGRFAQIGQLTDTQMAAIDATFLPFGYASLTGQGVKCTDWYWRLLGQGVSTPSTIDTALITRGLYAA